MTVALFGSLALFGLDGVAAAQPSVTRMAYDQCWADAGAWDLVCSVITMIDGHETVMANGVNPKWSPDASKIVFTGSTAPSEKYWLWSSWAEINVLNVADGSITPLTDAAQYNNWGPVWSRDGSQIAFVSQRDDWSTELYVMDANGANPRRVTQNIGFTGTFEWSSDNGRFVIVSDRDGAPELYVINTDGSNLTRLTTNVGVTGAFTWSADGTRIAFDCVVSGNADICAINSDGTDFVRLTSDPATDSGPVFSPVDDRIAFVTKRFGSDPEIAVMDAAGNVTRVAAGIGGGQPVWSPEGDRIAFGTITPRFYTGLCYFGSGAHNADDFCVPIYGIDIVNADGTGFIAFASGDRPDWFRALPGQPLAAFTYQCSGIACDFDAAGSFDSDATIASYAWNFGDGTTGSGPTAHHEYTTGNTYGVSLNVTDNSGATGIARIGVTANTAPVASLTIACNGPTCAFDGTGSSDPDGTIAHYEWYFGVNWGGTASATSYTFATGTHSATLIVTDNGGASNTMTTTFSVVNATPVASFTFGCAGFTCTFNGSGSSDPDGTITSYGWNFGDGAYGSGVTSSHTYATGGSYAATLTVVDNQGATTQIAHAVIVNTPPVASFTPACSGLTCSFNASASSDPDGTIASYTWSFGDGSTGSGVTANRTYASDGAYTVTLTVTDNTGATSTQAQSVTVATPAMHVGDLDGTSAAQPNMWTATVTLTIHTSSHQPLANAAVSGSWSDGGTSSCTTNASGQCMVAKSGIAKKTNSVMFTVTNVARATFVYEPADNHEPDGDSNGTAIAVVKP